jgi:hypothetical protein
MQLATHCWPHLISFLLPSGQILAAFIVSFATNILYGTCAQVDKSHAQLIFLPSFVHCNGRATNLTKWKSVLSETVIRSLSEGSEGIAVLITKQQFIKLKNTDHHNGGNGSFFFHCSGKLVPGLRRA